MIDPLETYERTKQVVKERLEEYLQLEGGARQLAVSNIRFDDKTDPGDFAGQAEAKNYQATWGAKILGDAKLVDKASGKVVSEARGVTLGRLPSPTPRFSYIVEGNEVAIRNQLRLRSGAYTVVSKGDVIKTQVNTSKGESFNILYDPARSTWVLSIRKAKQNPMYDVLQIMGMSDEKIAKELGEDSLKMLKGKSRGGIASQLYKTLFQYSPLEAGQDPAPLVKAHFDVVSEVNPETTKITLGQPFTHTTGDMMLAAMKKQLGVATGKAHYDERDSMIFKQVQLLDDHLGTRLRMHMAPDRKLGADWRRQAKNRIDRARDARAAVHSLKIDRTLTSFFKTESEGDGGLVDSSGLNNPITQLDSYNTTTISGPGGTDSKKITDRARALHTSTLGLIDPVHTPESEMVGAIGHLAYGIKRLPTKDTSVAAEFIDAKTGKTRQLTSTEASQTVIGFPEDWDLSGKPRPRLRMVTAIKRNKVQAMPYSEVEYIFPDVRNAFDVTLNSVPWLDSVSGARGVMAAKMMGQAIALKDPEAPIVQVEAPTGGTWEKVVAQAHLPKTTVGGVVSRVTPEAVFVRDGRKTHKIGLYHYFPVGTKASGQMHHSVPTVKVGDRVKPGQILANSNFTADHTLALGKNLTVAYLPYKGLNFEDGLVLSQSAAKKMTSEHLHRYQLDIEPALVVKSSAWKTHFPTEWRQGFEKNYGEDGVIHVGATVKPGEPLIMAIRRRQDENIPQSQRELRNLMLHMYTNGAVIYDQQNPGVVKSVVRGRKHIEVHVFAEHPTQVGDKMAGRYGNKGVVSAIIPDSEMPRVENGDPVDVLMNPMGVPGRINPAQLLETAVAKVGKPYVVKNFSPHDNLESVQQYLAKHGVSDTETITDPSSGRKIPKVMVGRQYLMKLEHEAEKKLLTSNLGSYTLDRIPGEGKNSNPQSIDHLTMYGMLAHGARANIRDMVTYKASRNDEFWRAIENRQPIPAPQSKFAYTKFVGMLKQLGVNVKREGDRLRLQPLTDNEVHEMASGEIKDISFVRAQDLKPEPGGLFDPSITGGLDGAKWSYFRIAEKIPNPTFEASVKSLIGVTQDQYLKLIRGDLGVANGAIVAGDKASMLRGAAIEALLKGVDVPKQLAATLTALKAEKSPDKRSRLYRKYRTLENLRDMKVSPDRAFMVSVVPVLPPIFRPIFTVPTGPTRVSPVNYLYRDAFGLSKQIEAMKGSGVPDTDEFAKDAYGQLYKAVAAIQGYQDPINRGDKYRGIMAQIRGEKPQGGGSPKEGWFQSNLVSHKQDISGRGVLVNGPELHIDQVGIPEAMAWDLYKQFTIVELMNLGMKGPEAKLELKKKTQFARQALEQAMKRRPVWVNRAPSLHRQSILAFEPKLIAGSQIKLHPFVFKGFNADIDGDTLAVHVPVTPAAVEEARHFFPSQHPFAVNGDLLTHPTNESQWGLWKMTQAGKATGKSFKSLAEANTAYGRGEISFTDGISIDGKKTTLGRSMINGILPEKMRDASISLNAKKVKEIIVTLARKDPRALPATLDALKDLGYQAAYEMGGTVTLKDVAPFKAERNQILARAEQRSKKQGVVEGYAPAIGEMHKMIESHDPASNSLVSMLHAGAAKKKFSIQQILGSPVLYTDSMGNPVATPVTRTFSEGLSPSEYWTSLYGARLGVIGRSHSTSKPGALAKDLIHSTIDNVVTKLDCGTTRGVFVPVNGIDALGRYLVNSVGGISENEPVTQVALEKLRDRKIEQVRVRSPLTCLAGQGTCAKCWGLDENGQLPKIGTNIGVISAHTITEPAVQLSMNAFHTGGIYGATKARTNLFAQVENLLSLKKKMPGKATLAEVAGPVTKITVPTKGGHEILIGSHVHYVPPQRTVSTEVGKVAKIGDALSDGVKDPREMAKLVGFANAQEQLAEAIRDTFAQGGGDPMPRKHFETVVRAAAGNVEVTGDPTGTYLPGQIVNFAHIDSRNHKRAVAMPVTEAIGKQLDEKVKGFEHLYGSVLTADHVKGMKKSRVRTVKAVADPITFDAKLHGIQWVPQRRENWVAQLAYRGLDRAIRQGAAEGWESNLHGVHPIPALVYGKEILIKQPEIEQHQGAY